MTEIKKHELEVLDIRISKKTIYVKIHNYQNRQDEEYFALRFD